jgi:hypothetical protein
VGVEFWPLCRSRPAVRIRLALAGLFRPFLEM